jgi:hypothetical protein
MSTDHHLTIGRQLAQMLGSLWAQAKVGLEVGLDGDDQCLDSGSNGRLSLGSSVVHKPLCGWSGNLTSNGLGSLDIGGRDISDLD